MIIEIIITLICITSGYIYYSKKVKNYWKERGVYTIDEWTGVFDVSKMISFKNDVSFFDLALKKYNEVKGNKQKYAGFYGVGAQTLLVTDPDILKDIMVNNYYDHFNSRGTYYNKKAEPLLAFLFDMEGSEWKNMRQHLTPTFTSGKMKMMFHTFVECSLELQKLVGEYANNGQYVPTKDVFARLTTDIIANTAFGINCNSLQNSDEEFRKLGKNLLTPAFWGPLKLLFIPRLPRSFVSFFKLRVGNSDNQDAFLDIVKQNADYREKNNVKKDDFFQLMLQLKNTGKGSDGKTSNEAKDVAGKLTIEEVTAQCILFFVAGFDTSSTTMALALYELSINPEIQNKLRESINEVLERHNGQITYEAIHEMSYLHMVISETMRKYPVLPLLTRKCTNSYKLPNANLTIEKGVKIWIPVSGLHRDPDYWPNPEHFDPERFLPERLADENITIRKNKMVYLPFGEGPRTCIGLRFGLLQSKVGLVSILRKFKVSLNENTVLPIKFVPRDGITKPQDDILLNFSAIC